MKGKFPWGWHELTFGPSVAQAMAPRRPPELYRAPFPLYALRVHREAGLAVIGGGGGAAKTGIKNGLVRRGKGQSGCRCTCQRAHEPWARLGMESASSVPPGRGSITAVS